MTSKIGPNLARSLRLALAIIGGYTFASGFVAVVGAGLPNLGMARTESAMLGGILSTLVFLAIIIWAVSSTRPVRTGVIICALSGVMIVAAPLMVPA